MSISSHLHWNLMKLCKGFKVFEIEIYSSTKEDVFNFILSDFEGQTKSEKILSLSKFIENKKGLLEIILPDGTICEF